MSTFLANLECKRASEGEVEFKKQLVIQTLQHVLNKTQPSQDLVEVSVDLLHTEGPDFVYDCADYIYRQAGRKDSDVSLHSNCSGKV